MALSEQQKLDFQQTLQNELKTAMGCTEPIAIAYCAALARKVLGEDAVRYEVACSGNIIKNVKSVVVPQTGGLHGIEAAVLAGAIGGDPSRELEVLSAVTQEHIPKIAELLAAGIVHVSLLDSPHLLHILVTEYGEKNTASVEILDSHTNIGTVRRNGEVIHERIQDEAIVEENTAEFLLADILEYADTVDIEAVSKVLEQQIEYNGAICAEGLKNDWGVTTGKTLMDESASMRENIIAFAAAGSDARMNGCAMPVVINSGSGNQGITVSIPVVAYAKEIGTSHEKLIRALVVANLVSLYQKKFIGRLSAFCGATSAAAGAIAGIAYLDGADESCISAAITNTIATVGGMVCDGAKSSCAMKIYTALSCAFMGYDLAKKGVAYCAGDGVVKDSIDATIHAVGRMAKQGMKETDKEILHIMLNQ